MKKKLSVMLLAALAVFLMSPATVDAAGISPQSGAWAWAQGSIVLNGVRFNATAGLSGGSREVWVTTTISASTNRQAGVSSTWRTAAGGNVNGTTVGTGWTVATFVGTHNGNRSVAPASAPANSIVSARGTGGVHATNTNGTVSTWSAPLGA